MTAYTTSSLAGLLVTTALQPKDADRTIFTGPPSMLDAAACAILRDAGFEPSAEDAAVFVRQFFGCFEGGKSGARTLPGHIVADWIVWRRAVGRAA